MKEASHEKEITNNELLRYMTDQFEKIFMMLDTKADKSDFDKLSVEIADIRKDAKETKKELKNDIAELRSEVIDTKDELKADIQSLRKDTNQRFFSLKRV